MNNQTNSVLNNGFSLNVDWIDCEALDRFNEKRALAARAVRHGTQKGWRKADRRLRRDQVVDETLREATY